MKLRIKPHQYNIITMELQNIEMPVFQKFFTDLFTLTLFHSVLCQRLMFRENKTQCQLYRTVLRLSLG